MRLKRKGLIVSRKFLVERCYINLVSGKQKINILDNPDLNKNCCMDISYGQDCFEKVEVVPFL